MGKRLLILCLLLHYDVLLTRPARFSLALTVYITTCPRTHNEKCPWEDYFNDLVVELNKWVDTQKKSVWVQINRSFAHCSQRYFSIIHSDKHFGSITLSVPHCVNKEDAIKQIQTISKNKKMTVAVEEDYPITIQNSPEAGMEGYSLSLDALEKVKHGGQLDLKNSPWTHDEIKEALFWYQSLPTTGLRINEKPSYPFVPHFFSLWELAPHKGKGVKIAIIDTGVAAFPVVSSSIYKKNYDLEMQEDFNQHSFNVVAFNGKDALEQLVLLLKTYIRPEAFNYEELELLAPQWIKELLTHSTYNNLTSYLTQHGNDKKAVGITKVIRFIRHTFSIIRLDYPYNKDVIAQMIPLAQVSSRKLALVAGHGSHTFGVIGGQLDNRHAFAPDGDVGICGLSPQADVIMIKAFQDNGTSTKSTLIASLKKAIAYKADIVNLSLKIADKVNTNDPSTILLDRLLGIVPYVVAASGNGTEQESYPARFENVTFDVGAFKYSPVFNADNKAFNYPILAFSQYKKNYGPKFVAPGYNILSSGLVPKQKHDSMYVFLTGTSMAAPIMTGFLALVLGEFNHDFTEKQLETVIYKSAIKLHNTDDWQDKTMLGVVDMRTALFMLHVLRAIKQKIKKNNIMYDIEKKFNNLVLAVHTLLFSQVNEFGKLYLSADQFEQAYADFWHKANRFRLSQRKEFDQAMNEMHSLLSAHRSIDSIVNYTADIVTSALNAQVAIQQLSESQISSLSDILMADIIDLFPHISPIAKQRLVKTKVVEHYWKKQAHQLQSIMQ